MIFSIWAPLKSGRGEVLYYLQAPHLLRSFRRLPGTYSQREIAREPFLAHGYYRKCGVMRTLQGQIETDQIHFEGQLSCENHINAQSSGPKIGYKWVIVPWMITFHFWKNSQCIILTDFNSFQMPTDWAHSESNEPWIDFHTRYLEGFKPSCAWYNCRCDDLLRNVIGSVIRAAQFLHSVTTASPLFGDYRNAMK